MASGKKRVAAPQVDIHNISLAPIVLIKGSEGLLADRAMARLRVLAREADPQVERTDLSAASYQSGQLDMVTSPSLFGEARMVIISDLETLGESLSTDLLAYIKHPASDVWLFLRHPGGNAKGKKVIDAIGQAGFPVISAEPLKKDKDKYALLMADAKAARRALDAEAAHMLVDALGADVRSMAAALAQLIADVEGRITVEDVRRYYSGRVEATGFEVADATISGNTAQALTLLRHALATGTDPVPLVAALAMKIRQMAKVSLPGQGHNLGMAPWQVDQARRQLRGWSENSLATAFSVLACADEEVKGASKDPHRAIEKAVVALCRLRGEH
ncbi:DNA polymerase III subunit delta [Schaalia sp. lx-100]|uniref:DNA polymerase III subunit delta n=1 Tax=Schaalia sp. lx-100 TaxID=2899081 RepID=UPI001E4373B3|nr:DNA polymerase III subunit delta [Schaalia sp. lx-100]MCD4558030.1 DNA polymerase III subunit delta [Schaalia sp. lx-100]